MSHQSFSFFWAWKKGKSVQLPQDWKPEIESSGEIIPLPNTVVQLQRPTYERERNTMLIEYLQGWFRNHEGTPSVTHTEGDILFSWSMTSPNPRAGRYPMCSRMSEREWSRTLSIARLRATGSSPDPNSNLSVPEQPLVDEIDNWLENLDFDTLNDNELELEEVNDNTEISADESFPNLLQNSSFSDHYYFSVLIKVPTRWMWRYQRETGSNNILTNISQRYMNYHHRLNTPFISQNHNLYEFRVGEDLTSDGRTVLITSDEELDGLFHTVEGEMIPVFHFENYGQFHHIMENY